MSVLYLATWIFWSIAPGTGPQTKDLVRELLDLPAPAPAWEKVIGPPRGQTPPADDAPVDRMLRYWAARQAGEWQDRLHAGKLPLPTDRMRQRLLEGCENKPEYVLAVSHFLPDTPAAAERIKKLYDQEHLAKKLHPEWSKQVRVWLMRHSAYFRDDLIQAARNATFKAGWLEGKDDLLALVNLDWERAAPILSDHANCEEQRRAAAAKAMLFQHAVNTRDLEKSSLFRNQLKAIVADRQIPPHARAMACQGLLGVEWPERDEWYLSLFADETLRELAENGFLFRPLDDPVRADPDTWVPVLARLVNDKSRAIRDNAVSCLIYFTMEHARKDALQPLLPWLTDRQWSSDHDRLPRDRVQLIWSLDRVPLPESVPGLIQVVEREHGSAVAGAARALAVYRDRRAIPALKKALDRENDERHRRFIVQALLACDALADEEIAEAVEAYADQMSTAQGAEELRGAVFPPLPKASLVAKVSLGYHLSYLAPARDQAAARLCARAESLAKQRPEVAGQIRLAVATWPGKAIDTDVVRRIGELKADVNLVTIALDRRKSLQANAADDLRALQGKSGTVGGLSAVLAGDRKQQAALLEGADRDAQRALLAAGRLIREPLPIDRVGKLLKTGDKELALAAERYLESEDSAPARRLVYDCHPGEIVILGARMGFDPGHVSYGEFDTWEKRLRDEMRGKNSPTEIYALLSAGYWGSAGQRIIRIRDDRAELSVHDGQEQPATRALSPAQMKELRAFVAEHAIDDLPPLTNFVADGIQYEYLHLTKNGGRRVFMNNPGMEGWDELVYERLTVFFSNLGR